ncbi:MAG: molecular chaperone [Burkholderiales bacterium]|nr:MAG: molecular chaperone [Burkholderiales bacterium]
MPLASGAHAAIVLQATRVIFDASNKEATMVVRNDGQEEALIQSWMASANEDEDPPFALVPPLARIPQQSAQVLRILFEGSGLPEDRESVAWLHVQDIPRNPSGDNVLQLAIRHAVKVFYRPKGLKGNVADAPREMTWRLVNDAKGAAIEVSNPSNYHVSMVAIRIGDTDTGPALADGQMIGPHATHRFPIDAAQAIGSIKLRFVSINDYGGDDAFQVTLQGNAAAHAAAIAPKAP